MVQAFLNTRWDLASEQKDERLVNPDALQGWLEERGLVEPGRRLDQRDLRRALDVREGLRALAFSNNGHRPSARALDAMRRASEGVATQIRLQPHGPEFVPAPASPGEAAISTILAMAARAMIEGSWQRLKACPGRHCGWVFYDQSRNHSARWCSMNVCGAREKARGYYRRRAGGER